MKLLIIEPWFCAVGHPAQSLLTLASAIGHDDRVEYLVSHNEACDFFSGAVDRLSSWGKVESYEATTLVGASNTLRALVKAVQLRRKGESYRRIFFFDTSLAALARFWLLFSLLLPVERLLVLHVFAPVSGRRRRISNFIIRQFLKKREVRLYLRTEEMVEAWKEAFPGLDDHKISYLPSLEIPDEAPIQITRPQTDQLLFGIIGQIRIGKGIEWIVPAFQRDPSLGRLTVAGEFNNDTTRKKLAMLQDFEGFINSFMSEEEMLQQAARQDYILVLYDIWDKRMESAVLYLAARVRRPVIVFDDSWCGRMVRKFGSGVSVPADRVSVIKELSGLPHPESKEYEDMLKGVDAFRQAFSVKSLRGKVVNELLN